jgi:hypothetical protein
MNINNIAKLQVQRAPASAAELQAALTHGGWSTLPKALLELLRLSNGFLTPGGIHVYGADDLAERNLTFEIAAYCAGYLLIGDNSGGKGYLMRLGGEDSPVYSSGLGDLEVAGFEKEADSLQEWVDGLS